MKKGVLIIIGTIFDDLDGGILVYRVHDEQKIGMARGLTMGLDSAAAP